MSIAQLSLSDLLSQHVTLELESIDRMYCNVYVPRLQHENGAAWFLRQQRGYPVASSAAMAPITRAFVEAIEGFVREKQLPLITFEKGQRKDDVAAEHLARFPSEEGVVFVGKAQEKTTTFRTCKGYGPRTADRYPRLYRSTAMVNHYYFYALDRDFGPFFLKFSSYFPYTAKLCLNGHEYLKRQLAREGIAYQPLDNGLLTCADPARAQALARALSAEKIEGLVRKWLARLPQPFTEAERAAGYDYDLSILQAEFALTQVWDRPRTGRLFFEEVIREHLDLGRPDQVQLIFERRVTRRTPGRFSTRVITEGVTPSLHVDYKHSRIKQYFKEGRALRTETTINNPRDFALGKRLHNLPALREVGFSANRRLLHVQSLSHDCALGEEAFQQVNQAVVQGAQRAAGLRFADPRVQALLAVLVLFRLQPQGFANRDLRPLLASLWGEDPQSVSAGRMTYHLRRLKWHGLIERLPGTHRYQVTDTGLRTALFFTRAYGRLLRPGLAHILPAAPPLNTALQRQFEKLETAMDDWVKQARFVT